MNLGLRELANFLDLHKNDPSLVLATVTATIGSSYRKPGAMMLIRSNHEFAGLISGGCLEGDLVEHADAVFDDGQARTVTYDLSNDEHAIWGLGLGCGGTVHLLLQRLDRDKEYEFLPLLFESVRHRHTSVLALVYEAEGGLHAGSYALLNDAGEMLGDPGLGGLLEIRLQDWNCPSRHQYAGLPSAESDSGVLLVRIQPSPRVLICGAGPDAVPMARQVDALGWQGVVVDHRAAYARDDRFPGTTRVIQLRPDQMSAQVDLREVDAAIVMSHNLEHDAAYMRQLAGQNLSYLGLLGPKARREQVQSLAGIEEAGIHGPAGFDIGAELPESIALSVMAEMHAILSAAGKQDESPG